MSNTIGGMPPPAPRPVPEAHTPVRAAAAGAQTATHAASDAKAAAAQAERRANAEETRRELQQAVERMNQQAIKDGRKLNFAMDQVTDQMVITVRKAETGEVIRQIPSEAVLRVAHNMEELKGLLHNRTS